MLYMNPYSGEPIPPLKGYLTEWQPHMVAVLALCNRPKAPLNDRSIAAFFVTAAIELLWHRNIGGLNRRNNTHHERSNGPLAVIFWAFAAILACRNSAIFL